MKCIPPMSIPQILYFFKKKARPDTQSTVLRLQWLCAMINYILWAVIQFFQDYRFFSKTLIREYYLVCVIYCNIIS